ncbi:hypothetical protein D8X77_22180 [Vibrio vulnificus]|uniref:hypothetical protein n=1 Tax=Vibrio TaxID=662 RepID=UPI000A869050|nr:MULTISPECIES: hypothetical protein [Vibrio]EKO3802391.1 hypothetical protein [Vibrio harveyi]EGR1425936.1 hypothetical protein [Vibrio vulnificus]EHV5553123.1 hypothetical protein [Vibrio vulnificus]MBS9830324.1 hypothetical protein [Vibrio alginolyticus]MCD1412437.1 hypothetical protein [Vibrio vulnificus]
MKKNCKNCHFLASEYSSTGSEFTNSFSLVQRDDIEKLKGNPLKGHYVAKCHLGVWREGATQSPDFYSIVVKAKRTNCFFYPYQENMLFKAAEKLQQRQQENAQLKRSNMYTRIGLFIAAIGLIFNALVNYVKDA